MSARRRNSQSVLKIYAPVFAALGDETRLLLVTKLSLQSPQSISQLAGDSDLTRQAVTKHLQALENVGLVYSLRKGRENLFEFEPKALKEVKNYLDEISTQWDQALSRLKTFVEND